MRICLYQCEDCKSVWAVHVNSLKNDEPKECFKCKKKEIRYVVAL